MSSQIFEKQRNCALILMDQICPILYNNWETECHTDTIPFQNSFGMAISVKRPIENLAFFNDAPLTGLFQWVILPSFTFSQFFTIFRRVFLEICDSSFLEVSKVRGPCSGQKIALRVVFVVRYYEVKHSAPSFGRIWKQLIGSRKFYTLPTSINHLFFYLLIFFSWH